MELDMIGGIVEMDKRGVRIVVISEDVWLSKQILTKKESESPMESLTLELC